MTPQSWSRLLTIAATALAAALVLTGYVMSLNPGPAHYAVIQRDLDDVMIDLSWVAVDTTVPLAFTIDPSTGDVVHIGTILERIEAKLDRLLEQKKTP